MRYNRELKMVRLLQSIGINTRRDLHKLVDPANVETVQEIYDEIAPKHGHVADEVERYIRQTKNLDLYRNTLKDKGLLDEANADLQEDGLTEPIDVVASEGANKLAALEEGNAGSSGVEIELVAVESPNDPNDSMV